MALNTRGHTKWTMASTRTRRSPDSSTALEPRQKLASSTAATKSQVKRAGSTGRPRRNIVSEASSISHSGSKSRPRVPPRSQRPIRPSIPGEIASPPTRQATSSQSLTAHDQKAHPKALLHQMSSHETPSPPPHRDPLHPDAMPISLPTTTNDVRRFPRAQITADATATRIVVHPTYPALVQAFLQHKRRHGSRVEKTLYRTEKTFTWRDEIARLVAKRPLVFVGANDYTVLRDGTALRGRATREWDRVGRASQAENEVLMLEEYLSYDEMMLGSLLGVSGPSFFVNEGGRANCGRAGAEGTFEERGVIMGLVGARFEREGRMDGIFCLPPVEDEEDGEMHPDLVDVFVKFFGEKYDRRRALASGLDPQVYYARMRISIDMMLLEAARRGREDTAGRSAYLYVVGLGLGVWALDMACQQTVYLEAFADALEELDLEGLSTIEFAWINASPKARRLLEKRAERKDIDVVFSKRNPAAKLEGEHSHELLCLSYAWDGNAFPGNEYWSGSLSASGDPAAACMSTIAQLHNPIVNPEFLSRIVVAGTKVDE